MKIYLCVLLLTATGLLNLALAQPSYYYTKGGQKQTGTIVFHPGSLQGKSRLKSGSIRFRQEQKSYTLLANELSCFVMGVDSFAVLKRLQLQENQARPFEDIVQVIEKGTMSLYLHVQKQGHRGKAAPKETYVVTLAGLTKPVCLYAFDRQQQALASLFKATPRLQELVMSGKVRVEDLPNLVKAYNTASKYAYSTKTFPQTK